MSFLRFEEMEFQDAPEPPPAPARARRSKGLTAEDLASSECGVFMTPRSAPLAPWSRLWPVLRGALQAKAPGRDPDTTALVRAWARGDALCAIPRVPRTAWAGRASVWIDRSARLVPFWSDQISVCQQLRRVCGRDSLEVRYFEELARPQHLFGTEAAPRRVDPQRPVLLLGDLGTYGSEADRAAWLSVGRRLRRGQVRVAALVPSPPARWDPVVANTWSAVAWEQGRLRAARTGRQPDDIWRARADELLRVASPAMLVQPGLLRALRRLLPAWRADAATEADAWSHPDVRVADPTGMILHAEASERLRTQFAGDLVDPETRARVSEAIRDWHRALPRELLRIETLLWHAQMPGEEPPGDIEDARGFADRLAETMWTRGEDPELAEALRTFCRQWLEGMPGAAYKAIPSLNRIWAAAFQGVTGARVPAGVERWAVFAAVDDGPPPPKASPRWWAVRQVGRELVLSPSPSSAWPSHDRGPGSPVAWLLAEGPILTVSRESGGVETRLLLEEGLSIPLRAGEGLSLRSDRAAVRLRVWQREKWAVAAGKDRFGLWAEADLKGVVVRFRWIPPGRFWMGSPEDEAGRFEWEGPRHQVMWTTGHWLADAPVTQALWQAVMGENPSRFASPDRPVEQVSWDVCGTFLRKLNAGLDGLDARLPSEAEWEHACRAGSETATWLGDLEILGENNAPLLDSIAWYGGNCGRDFELKEGYDRSEWPNKQYDDPQGGTHPVRKKAANPVGLYDMLGNVFEWCLDWWASNAYSSGDRIDPLPYAAGSDRVYRGGSWGSDAGSVRAAYRYAYPPDNRFEDLGLRLARGPAPGPRSGATPEGAERPPNRGAGRATVTAAARDASRKGSR